MRGLYAILDTLYVPADDLLARCQALIAAGCKVIQYRDKPANPAQYLNRAKPLHQLCQQHGVLFIVNDHLAAATALGSGLHVGGDDTNLSVARQTLGPNAVIGASCYNQLALAQSAKAEGASYVAFGAFFGSGTKPSAVSARPSLLTNAQQLQLPIVAIGGITPDNGAQLVEAGADMLAVIGSLWQAPELSTQVKRFQLLFQP